MGNTPDYDKREYYGYVGNEQTNVSWGTLDEALVGVIAIRHEGHGTQAAVYFFKMVSA